MEAVRVRVASLLHAYTGGASTVEAEGTNIGEVMAALDKKFPGLAFRVIDEQGCIRPHMSVFVGVNRVRDPQAPVPTGSEVFIVGALSGG